MSSPQESPSGRRGASFAVEQRDHGPVVVVEGDLDLASAPLMKDTLTNLLRGGSARIVLDFSGVRFLDSTALSVLIAVDRRLGPHERLAIAEVNAHVLRVFDLSGTASSFRIFPSVDAAVAHVAGGGTAEAPVAALPLSADAALLVGIASTAMPFAQSEEEEAERWLRVLRGHGEAGVVLGSLGVIDAPVSAPASEPEPPRPRDADPVATVTERAARIAGQRQASRITTIDVLLAVMRVYGATFDRVLSAHGGDLDELATRISSSNPAHA